MRRSGVRLLLATLAVGGCVPPARQDVAVPTMADGVYDCAGHDALDARRVRVRTDPATGTLVVDLGHRLIETLRPVPGADGTYANSLWAWRAGNPDSTLTDIENIETSSCRPEGGADAASAS